MVKKYQVNRSTRIVNFLMSALVRLGIGPGFTYMLTVPGRKSGEYHSNPVSIVQDGENKYLVSPYGEVNWVKNARAAGEVTLSRGGRSTRYAIEEVSPEVSGQVLKMYMTQETITQPYFDAKPISPVEEFIAEAHRHPVFRLTEK